jgi:hypothetical protein
LSFHLTTFDIEGPMPMRIVDHIIEIRKVLFFGELAKHVHVPIG